MRTGRFNQPIRGRNQLIIIEMSGTFKIGDWVWDGDEYGMIDHIEEDGTINLFNGKEGWSVDPKTIMPDRRPIGFDARP